MRSDPVRPRVESLSLDSPARINPWSKGAGEWATLPPMIEFLDPRETYPVLTKAARPRPVDRSGTALANTSRSAPRA